MTDLEEIQMLDFELRPYTVQSGYNAGTVWCKLSGIPTKDWEEAFKSAYDRSLRESSAAYRMSIPRDHQHLVNPSGHIYTIGKAGTYIIVPVDGVSLQAVEDWLRRFVEECIRRANLREV